MGAQARQNRRGNEMLQLHGKITHQEKLRDARGTNKPTKTKSIYKQAKPTDRQQTGSSPPTPPPTPDADGAAIGATRCSMNRSGPEWYKSFTHIQHRTGAVGRQDLVQ